MTTSRRESGTKSTNQTVDKSTASRDDNQTNTKPAAASLTAAEHETNGEPDFVLLLRAIGWVHEDLMSACTDAISPNHPDGNFRPHVMPAAKVVKQVTGSEYTRAGNTWFGVQPLRRDFNGKGKGTAKDVRAIRALYADLDFKPGGLGSIENARTVIDEVSKVIGVRPVAVVSTGGGLQPYWQVKKDSESKFEAGSEQWLQAVKLLRRFGRLVASIAEKAGGKIDSVYNLDRILRVPGTANRKYPTSPMATVEILDGRPIRLARLAEILDAKGVAAFDEDSHVVGQIVSPPQEWSWALDGTVCRYVEKMATGWQTEEVGGRHSPWFIGQAVRLAVTHRFGLVTEAQYQAATEALTNRFLAELDRPGDARSPKPGEVAYCLDWGQAKAAAKTDAEAATELGGHVHDGDVFRSDGCTVPGVEAASGAGEDEPDETPAGGEDDETEADEDWEATPRLMWLTPSAYFYPGVMGLRADRLGKHILASKPCALTPEGNIAVYQDGVYRVDPEALNVEVKTRLEGRYRPAHLKTANGYLRAELYVRPDGSLPDHCSVAMLNCPNGMLDLVTAELKPHDPSYLSSVQIPIEWDPDATCPNYLRWAKSIGIEDILDDLEEVCSAMLDPSRTPSKAGFLHGPSKSGKSTYLRIVAAVAGRRNTSSVSLHQLSDNRFAAANVFAKMLNTAADLSSAHVQDLSVFKMLTGADQITADRKYGNQFEFTNKALFLFSANDVPTVSESSTAYSERIKPFRFAHSFAGREDPSIEDAIMGELPGILVRLVRAWQRMHTRGGYQPTDAAARDDFEQRSNRVYRWFVEECDLTELPANSATVGEPTLPPWAAMTGTELAVAFNAWAMTNGMTKMGRDHVINRLKCMDGVRYVRIGNAKRRGFNITVTKNEES